MDTKAHATTGYSLQVWLLTRAGSAGNFKRNNKMKIKIKRSELKQIILEETKAVISEGRLADRTAAEASSAFETATTVLVSALNAFADSPAVGAWATSAGSDSFEFKMVDSIDDLIAGLSANLESVKGGSGPSRSVRESVTRRKTAVLQEEAASFPTDEQRSELNTVVTKLQKAFQDLMAYMPKTGALVSTRKWNYGPGLKKRQGIQWQSGSSANAPPNSSNAVMDFSLVNKIVKFLERLDKAMNPRWTRLPLSQIAAQQSVAPAGTTIPSAPTATPEEQIAAKVDDFLRSACGQASGGVNLGATIPPLSAEGTDVTGGNNMANALQAWQDGQSDDIKAIELPSAAGGAPVAGIVDFWKSIGAPPSFLNIQWQRNTNIGRKPTSMSQFLGYVACKREEYSPGDLAVGSTAVSGDPGQARKDTSGRRKREGPHGGGAYVQQRGADYTNRPAPSRGTVYGGMGESINKADLYGIIKEELQAVLAEMKE